MMTEETPAVVAADSNSSDSNSSDSNSSDSNSSDSKPEPKKVKPRKAIGKRRRAPKKAAPRNAAKRPAKAKSKKVSTNGTRRKTAAGVQFHVMSVHIPLSLMSKLDKKAAANKKAGRGPTSRSEFAVNAIQRAL